METKKIIKHHIICFVAGKSGGHILPCITLAQHMVNKHPDYEIAFFSTASALDKQLINGNAIVKHYVPLTLMPFPKKNICAYPRFICQLIVCCLVSFNHLRALKPEAVISTGGLIGVPVCLAARLLGIPIELFELNVIPGKAIKLLSLFASKIWICAEKTKRYLPASKCQLTQYPIKFNEQTSLDQQQALKTIQLNPKRKTILVLGGSQGSLFINKEMLSLVKTNPSLKTTIQIIHQTGSWDNTNWKDVYDQHDIPSIVFSYSDELALYYAAADLVICRAGAGTLAEISFFNKRCITIPLENNASNHQIDNARAAAHTRPDLFSVLSQRDIEQNNHTLFNTISSTLELQ